MVAIKGIRGKEARLEGQSDNGGENEIVPWRSPPGPRARWRAGRNLANPTWGEHRESVTTSRAARLARYERLLSRRYGEPISCAGLAGPEACNGGWVK